MSTSPHSNDNLSPGPRVISAVTFPRSPTFTTTFNLCLLFDHSCCSSAISTSPPIAMLMSSYRGWLSSQPCGHRNKGFFMAALDRGCSRPAAYLWYINASRGLRRAFRLRRLAEAYRGKRKHSRCGAVCVFGLGCHSSLQAQSENAFSWQAWCSTLGTSNCRFRGRRRICEAALTCKLSCNVLPYMWSHVHALMSMLSCVSSHARALAYECSHRI